MIVGLTGHTKTRGVDGLVAELARAIHAAMQSVAAPHGSRRPSTKSLYAALKKNLRPVLEAWFGGPILCRYSGCPEGPAKGYSKTPKKVFKVLEYLWDFSFSRFAIPQAIRDPHATPMTGGKFELVFVAESELGNKNEVCRDLLKLLEARTSVRCLIYKQPRRTSERKQLEARMIQVMQGHAHFLDCPGIWILVGLTWTQEKITCDVSTLAPNQNAFAAVDTAALE